MRRERKALRAALFVVAEAMIFSVRVGALEALLPVATLVGIMYAGIQLG